MEKGETHCKMSNASPTRSAISALYPDNSNCCPLLLQQPQIASVTLTMQLCRCTKVASSFRFFFLQFLLSCAEVFSDLGFYFLESFIDVIFHDVYFKLQSARSRDLCVEFRHRCALVLLKFFFGSFESLFQVIFPHILLLIYALLQLHLIFFNVFFKR